MHDPHRAERGFTIHPPLDGAQTLETDRLRLSWRPQAVDTLSESQLVHFRRAMMVLMGHFCAEHNDEQADAAVLDRNMAEQAFATVFSVPGTSLVLPDRNARYTSMMDGECMAEPLDPSEPAEVELGRVDGIPNPLNYAE